MIEKYKYLQFGLVVRTATYFTGTFVAFPANRIVSMTVYQDYISDIPVLIYPPSKWKAVLAIWGYKDFGT